MIQVNGTNVTIMVTDLDRAISFYSGVFGFKLKNRYGSHWAELVAPGMTISLHPSKERIERGINVRIGLAVEDFNKALETLDRREISYEIRDDENIRLAFLSDPDHNTLYIASEWE